MKLDPGMHIGMHLVFFGKSGVTYCRDRNSSIGSEPIPWIIYVQLYPVFMLLVGMFGHGRPLTTTRENVARSRIIIYVESNYILLPSIYTNYT
jgi:hypothetical protein